MEEIILGEILNWDNNILNLKDNVEITKKAFDKQTYNKNI